MQDYITKDNLIALGIKLDDQNIDSLLAHLNETVEERIGAEIAQSLSDDELKELIALQESASDEELGKWIASHVSHYEEIIQDTIDIVIGELADSTDGINTAA